ncbi:MAG: integrase core domain-containing protein [Candidatus Synoicihabitans palmerolidicus]|nr:integrase core domain-containing protein [Candidatus Synoicihabitans palmerolidicus]
MQRAMAIYGKPEICNTDQGCQFTSAEFTQPLLAAGVRLSMDGKGRCLDHVLVERLWRSVKYEEVYLKRYETMVEAHANLETYLLFYNDDRRPHSAHGRQTPSEVYHAQLDQAAA